MTCPKCHSELGQSAFDNTDDGSRDRVCPECGVRLLRNVSGVMKTSAVMIAARGESGFYRSVQDVPEPLRTQLIETTTSPNSGIIVIADRAGKEQLTQVMARRASSGRTDQNQYRSREAADSDTHLDRHLNTPRDSAARPWSIRLPWLAWGGFVAVLVLAALIYAIFQTDWAIFSFHLPHW